MLLLPYITFINKKKYKITGKYSNLNLYSVICII